MMQKNDKNISSPTSATSRVRRFMANLSACLLVGSLAGCSVTGVFNSIIPESGFESTRDIAYGQLQRQKLDVYKPVVPPGGNATAARPVVVFFFGGAWDSGDKSSYLFAAEALTSRGYLVVIPNYRVYPEVIFPTYMDDAAMAVKWTFDNAARLGGDTERVFVMGHSAGGQLAALLAYDPKYLGSVGLDRSRLRGIISMAGPLDFLPLDEPKLFLIFPEPVRAASQPINFITGKEPPTLLLHGLDDKRVGIHNSRNLAARIRERGGRVEDEYYPGVGHVGIILAISSPFRQGKPELERVAKFIDEQSARKR